MTSPAPLAAASTAPARAPAATPVISARGLARTFRTKAGTVEAVRGLDLDVAESELVAFLGPNGLRNVAPRYCRGAPGATRPFTGSPAAPGGSGLGPA